jgi:hypothetical protein
MSWVEKGKRKKENGLSLAVLCSNRGENASAFLHLLFPCSSLGAIEQNMKWKAVKGKNEQTQ